MSAPAVTFTPNVYADAERAAKWSVDPEESDLGVLVDHENHEVALLPWDTARDLARCVNLSLAAERARLRALVLGFALVHGEMRLDDVRAELLALFEVAR